MVAFLSLWENHFLNLFIIMFIKINHAFKFKTTFFAMLLSWQGVMVKGKGKSHTAGK
ncbi:uncharacterized protein BDV14DRAFT_181790 [Aspergillus stella-maris]|uniref:uncharacterized protein n=1 Tax=Aspergillus stella-maris TaxID=1810926 RepID=UPI003CCCDF02